MWWTITSDGPFEKIVEGIEQKTMFQDTTTNTLALDAHIREVTQGNSTIQIKYKA